MAKLLYSAHSADGQRTEGFVEAPSVQAALRQLQGQGLRDVRLHQDLSSPQDDAELQGLGDAQQRELARFKLQLMQAPGLRTVLAEVARRLRLWLIADAAVVGYGLWRPDGWAVGLGLAAAALPFALTAWNFRHADRYQRFLRQFAVGNWDAVRVLARELRVVSRRRPELDFDLDLRLAAIYARDRSLPEAMARLEPWRARWAAKPGYFEMRVAAVCVAAGDTAGYLDLMTRAHAQAPDDATRLVDHALAEARYGDADTAQALLDRLDERQLPAHGQGFATWLRGLLQLRQGSAEAEPTLSQAVGALLQLQAHPVTWPPLAMCTCDHAVALHRAGRDAEARQRIAQVWPILKVHAPVPLLRMLDADGLLPERRPPA